MLPSIVDPGYSANGIPVTDTVSTRGNPLIHENKKTAHLSMGRFENF